MYTFNIQVLWDHLCYPLTFKLLSNPFVNTWCYQLVAHQVGYCTGHIIALYLMITSHNLHRISVTKIYKLYSVNFNLIHPLFYS